MRRLLVLIVATAFSLTAFNSLAQSTNAETEAAKAAKAKKKQDYANKQKAMQDASKSSASGPVPGATTDKNAAKHRPTATDAMESQMQLQANKPSKPVVKEAKP
jgi:hypothetical protein